jgi:hypothetical protein
MRGPRTSRGGVRVAAPNRGVGRGAVARPGGLSRAAKGACRTRGRGVSDPQAEACTRSHTQDHVGAATSGEKPPHSVMCRAGCTWEVARALCTACEGARYGASGGPREKCHVGWKWQVARAPCTT